MQQDRKQITEAGFDAYVGKPINLKEFLDTVQQRAGACPRARNEHAGEGARRRRHAGTTSSCSPTCSPSRATRWRRPRPARRRSRSSPPNRPDLVLLDVMMPGLSGYDVCRRIRADPATALLPVVLVTSLDPHGERVKGIEAGADDFLSQADQPGRAVRARALAAAGQVAAGRGRGAGRRAEGMEREARGARRRAGRASSSG